MTINPILQQARQIAEKAFLNTNGSHDWDHTLRVLTLCNHIGPLEGADELVLTTAAYFHDLGRGYQDASGGVVCHAQKGAEIVETTILPFLPLSHEQKENIVHCIRTHRFRGNHRPDTIEAKVLFDADKLDSIGAIGIARTFLFAGEIGAKLHNENHDITNTEAYSHDDTGYREYKLKLNKIIDRIITHEGRRIARERHAFMVAFFNRFIEEIEGKK